jgi:plasmid stabilization system protein ParE
MAFRVSQTQEVDHELESILFWLRTEEAGDAGLRWFKRLAKALESLREFPKRCPIAPESIDSPVEVRQLVFGRKPHFYRILFTIELDTVTVLHVRHGRRSRTAEQS